MREVLNDFGILLNAHVRIELHIFFSRYLCDIAAAPIDRHTSNGTKLGSRIDLEADIISNIGSIMIGWIKYKEKEMSPSHIKGFGILN